MAAQELAGRVALVTGASRGIGAAIAERFARAGATVVVAARTVDSAASRLEGTIHETVERIREAGGTAVAIAADVSIPAERERLVAEATDQAGQIDVLVNNAAVTYFVPVTEFTAKRVQLMLDVQVIAPMHLAQLVLPSMAQRGEGWILNISSIAARHPPRPGRAAPRDRRHGLRHVQGGAGAVLDGARVRGLGRQRRGQRAVAEPRRPDARHALPPPRPS